MKNKGLLYIIVALILVVFAFGSIYTPKSYIDNSKKQIATEKSGKVVDNQVVEPTDSKVVHIKGAKKDAVVVDSFDSELGKPQLLSEKSFKDYLAKNKKDLNWLDLLIVGLYAVMIVSLGLFASRVKKGHERNAEDYFLAGKSLPWWAIGSSLIAANISAEQFVGMSGSGFAIGLAIATYEWMAALTLIIVGKYFLPIFIKENIFTIPEFVEKRYNRQLKTILAVFWIALFVFVNLTSVLYLGARAMSTITGLPLFYGILIIAFFAAAYSLWGGLSAVAWTDVVQVVFLVLGGIITSIIAVGKIDGGLFGMVQQVPEKFEMILTPDNPAFASLPGIGVLLGGMWVANLYYWGFNQYIIQRTFAAKSLKESQRGIAFAAVIKLIIPFIVVIPGIAAFILFQDGQIPMQVNDAGSVINDSAYPVLLGFLPNGLRGVAFAALIAAIVSSLASMLNSVSTIFTMDIFKTYIKKDASDKATVRTGRLTAIVALIIAVLLAPLMKNLGQAFQFIQEYTGLVSAPILAIFILGLFCKRTTPSGAISGILLGTTFGLVFKLLVKSHVIWDVPFMHQMGITSLFSMLVALVISLIVGKRKASDKAIILEKGIFKTDSVFNIVAFAVLIVLIVLYSLLSSTGVITSIFG